MIKLIAIDLDGTLLTDEKTITDRNKEVLTKAKEQGVKVVLCTGRPLIAVESYLNRLELRDPGDYSITFNGGAVQKNDTGEELLSYSLTLKDVQDMAEMMTELDLPLDVISVDTCYNLTTSKSKKSLYETLNPILDFKTVSPAELDESITFNKMVVGVEPAYLDEKLKQLPQEWYDRFNIMKSRECLLEIIHPEVSKAHGIDLLAKELGIKQSEVMAIGDEENDVSMIEYAGMGVVMGNGNERVKKLAQFVTKSNEEDGVAYAVEKFVLTK
ncbi:Cof-type HAD-IIB family hydrolase [Vagococcus carniphilus]|uniref:Cof-type HAD-IIB family hydrolase n=1 Tax=Vagococcus carniphilus TaxID=218144 RepID=A0AAW8U7S4_9ENTE|nr:Cof-type HAD-IIB family hydrolase [Vagococcus carniphilus]MDT2830143.1 Cof-type HAD-IIB family hydrolase [Vagococcus carniphilus]MDT2833829.1 Cof-type HAD-IIB family hydrolase [Vagococcus carniphilus]MDT2838575.1 Cof-type HAD-IIB family hydrolase [Vagococcus carniphilus]MDT2853413.1 Cof-type HAD-IIB family hydrolase [Vagococcus carniphilus]